MEIQKNLLHILLKEVIDNSHDTNKVISDFSLYESSKDEKGLLCKGILFSVKSKYIKYSGFLLPLSYQCFANNPSPSELLATSEFKRLRHLSKNKNIVIQKADKDNTIAILH